ncbi:phosphoadenylyl-sulfate reductase [Martelella lutilitoris]|uniref:Adenosine 5'-phosphosulfate reductase n=1 Tax=Martelella lutilitoris TaxID=2583532 RepID=A0A7T7HP22_9HYPH|nr:phosphoadenylyl-sulfate reductase [Martelella lutilitoris]QQM32692.1 phosphoadenylyl-sulfate reductase [Martelella lutilitoris]
MTLSSKIDLEDTLAALDLEGRLRLVAESGRPAVFTTSLGIEDQVLTGAIAMAGLPIRIVTLDTGRLFDETLQLIEDTEARFGIAIERFHPRQEAVDAYVAEHGRNGFYESVDARHACCHIRKLDPLAQALEGAAYWITGLRRGQSGNRATTPFYEEDKARHLTKINPLADWNIADIRAFAERNDVPLNPLHERGYPSIGCAPCTRAIKPGEPERAGRWWWENDAKRECGLHVGSAAR